MAKVDFSRKLKNVDGDDMIEVIVNGEKTDERISTLKSISVNALISTFEDERGLDGVEKMKRYQLAMKINKSTSLLELQSEDVSLIKKLVGKAFGPMAVGQAYEYLENAK